MSFSTLPPDSRTLVSKWNTKLALIWKEDFGRLGNSPVLLLLSPGKTPLTTTVAKFLDMSVCGGSWCPVHSLWSSPKFLNTFCLTILIRLWFSRLVVHLFLTFTFMHLSDAFIQSDLQCIQVIHFLSVCVFPENRTHNLCAANAML